MIRKTVYKYSDKRIAQANLYYRRKTPHKINMKLDNTLKRD